MGGHLLSIYLGYQKSVAQNGLYPMSQSSVSRCINEVVPIMMEVFGHKIKFPISEHDKKWVN